MTLDVDRLRMELGIISNEKYTLEILMRYFNLCRKMGHIRAYIMDGVYFCLKSESMQIIDETIYRKFKYSINRKYWRTVYWENKYYYELHSQPRWLSRHEAEEYRFAEKYYTISQNLVNILNENGFQMEILTYIYKQMDLMDKSIK